MKTTSFIKYCFSTVQINVKISSEVENLCLKIENDEYQKAKNINAWSMKIGSLTYTGDEANESSSELSCLELKPFRLKNVLV